ncbi:hypothetical protein JKF63_00128 [Porcisia hertigi]|uniref:Uncharacterized protein n=1 Tax=Porcisia hertigi TaxID=2761500 RepID=A0A836KWV0_9TRYP|nr:hypothetical protein JKF63_00128 [Porcisia hertigi]
MRFRVGGGPLTSTIDLEIQDTDSVKSIFERLQEAAGPATPLETYDLYPTTHSPLTGERVTVANPLRITDTPATLSLDYKPNEPRILLLVRKGTSSEPRSVANSLFCSAPQEGNSGSGYGAAAQSTTAEDAAKSLHRNPPPSTDPPPSPKTAGTDPASVDGRYRERLVALYHMYNPPKLHTVEGTLKRFAGKEEMAIQQLVRRYGAEPPPLTAEEALSVLAAVGASGSSDTAAKATLRTANTSVGAAARGRDSHSESTAERPPQKPSDPRQCISAIFAVHEFDKLDKVERILENDRGREEEEVARLGRRYATHRGGKLDGESTIGAAEALVDTEDSRAVASTAQASVAPTARHGLSTTLATTPAKPVSPSVPPSPPQTAPLSTYAGPPTACQAAESARPCTEAPMPSGPPRSPGEGARGAPSAPVEIPQGPSLPSTTVTAVATPQIVQGENAEPLAASVYPAKKTASVRMQPGLWLGSPASTTEHHRPSDTVKSLATVASYEDAIAQGGQSSECAQPRTLSSEMQMAVRALLASLRHCVESQVIQVQSSEERQLADMLLTQWSAQQDLGLITDSPQLAHALHQAAYLIDQLDDLMTVIRTQAGQLQELKMLHRDILTRMEKTGNHADPLGRLEVHLDPANDDRSAVSQKGKRITARGLEGPASRSTPRPMNPASEECKDAQIAKLQQELAKTRNSLFLFKESEQKMRVQLQHSQAREARREHGDLYRGGITPRCTTPAQARAQPRSRSAGAGYGANQSLLNSSPRRSPRAFTPPGAFSYTAGQRTRHRQWTSQVKANGHAISSICRPDGATGAEERTNVSVNRSTPWPSSRYVMAPSNVDWGRCPNCLTLLTSCCSESSSFTSDKAAFCFSCRRYFTFGDLRVRNARELIDQL